MDATRIIGGTIGAVPTLHVVNITKRGALGVFPN